MFWPLIILWGVLSVAKETMALIDGQYTIRLAIVTAVANILTMITLPIVFLNQNLLNPVFSARIGQFFQAQNIEFAFWPLQNFGVFIVSISFFALILDTLVTQLRHPAQNISIFRYC
jgi:hypothetical protein